MTVKGFNPLVPGDAEASGIPIAVLCYEVTNTSQTPVDVSICGSIRNFIGKDGSKFVTDWKGDYILSAAKTTGTSISQLKDYREFISVRKEWKRQILPTET